MKGCRSARKVGENQILVGTSFHTDLLPDKENHKHDLEFPVRCFTTVVQLGRLVFSYYFMCHYDLFFPVQNILLFIYLANYGYIDSKTIPVHRRLLRLYARLLPVIGCSSQEVKTLTDQGCDHFQDVQSKIFSTCCCQACCYYWDFKSDLLLTDLSKHPQSVQCF